MKKIFTIFLVALSLFRFSYAQSIRKDYREFTQQEVNDYVAALNILFDNGNITNLANHHSEHFNSVIHTTNGHNGEQFLSWHRFFMLDFEQMLKNSNTNYQYLSLPYWDWTTDQASASPDFWNNNFLPVAKLPGWNISRSIGNAGFLGTTADINNTLNLIPLFSNVTFSSQVSNDFSHRLEYYHNFVHVWVGGTMNTGASPKDPVFYLHHNQVDRLWQQWEDKNTGIQTANTLINVNNPLVSYENITSAQLFDSRKLPRPASAGTGRLMDVWCAKNGKVILDGANGNDFVASDISVPYLYLYTAATSPGANTVKGEIYVGNIQRDVNDNIIADNKGGFKVNNKVKCNFRAGASVSFLPGFTAEYGCVSEAKIITLPNDSKFINDANEQLFVKNNSAFPTENTGKKDISVTLEPDFTVYPNPNNGIFTITVNNIDKGIIEIYNLAGNKIFTTNLKTNISDYKLNLSHYPSGVYLISISSKTKKAITKKIILK